MPDNFSSFANKVAPVTSTPSRLGTEGLVAWKDTNASRYTNDPNWKMLGYDMNRNNDYAYDVAQTSGQWASSAFNRFLHPLKTSFVEGFRYDKTAKELLFSGSVAEDEGLREYLKKSEELSYLYPTYDNPNSSDEGFFSYFNAGARNKWSTLLESSGFMVGTAGAGIAQSIVLGLVTGGAGTVASLAKTADATGKAYRLSKLASAYKQMDKVNDLWKMSKVGKLVGASPTLQAIDGLTDIAKARTLSQYAKASGKFLGNSAIRFQATSSEAMLEAIEGSEHFKKQQIEQFELKNGREATKEEKDDIENYAADVFSARYRANLGVLSVTNLVQDLSFFNTYKYISKLGKSGAIAEEAAKKWNWNAKAGIAMKHSALPLKERALFEIKAVGNSFFKNAFMEGVEEGAQYAIGKSTDDYYTKKYNKESASFMDSMARGISSTFLDKEGKESFWSGIMMGGLFSTIGKGAKTVHGMATGKGAKIDAMVSEQMTNYNQAHKNLIETFKTEQVLSAEAENGTLNHVNNTLVEEALENNDLDKAKELRLQSLRNSVKTAKEVGKLDLLKKSLSEYGELQDDVFREKFGVTSKQTNKEIVNETLREIEEIEKTVDAVNERYGNPYDGYDNIDPITAADKRAEQHNLYKGYEEAKMTVIDNVETLKESKKNLSKISEWFTGQGVVVEDVLLELVPEQITLGGVEFDSAVLARDEKIENLGRQFADLEKLKQTSTNTSEIIRVTQTQAELLKERDIYVNLNNNPDSLGAILDYFNFQIGKSKKGLPIDATDSTEFKTSLEENIKGLRDNLEKSKNALEALDALEKPKVFEALAKDYAKAYDKRYGQIISDLDANEQEAKAATEEVVPEETPEETIGTPVTPESPVETATPIEPEEGPMFPIPPYTPKESTKPQPKHVLLQKIVQVEKELDEITHVTNSLLSTKVRLTNLLQKEIAELKPVLEKLARTVVDSNTMYFISNYEELRDAEIRLQADVDKLTDELNIVSEELARVEKVRDYIRNKLTYYNQLRKEPGIRSVNYENIIYGKIQLLETKLKFLTSLINKVKKAISRMMDDLRYVTAQLRQNEADIISYPLDTEVDADLTTNREKRAPLQQEFTKQKNRVKALSRTVENTKDTIEYLYDLLEWGERTNSEEIDTPIEEIKAPKLQTLTDNISNEEKEKLIESKEEQIKKIDELIQQKTDEVLGADGVIAEIEKEESSATPNQARLQVLYEKRDKLQKETAALATKKEIVKNRFGKEIVKEEKYIIDSQDQVQNTLKEDLDVSSKIVKSVYLSGLHYVQTEDGKYYVVPNVSEGSNGITSKEVTQAEIIKPFRTKKEWDELEVKKADIERRRQEELNNIKSKAEIEKYFANKFKNEFPNGVNESGIISIQEVLEKLLNEDEHKLIEQYRYSNILKDKINAKYDAEYVDAVKKGEMTKEQAMQALKEVGRKDSKAYAELAALEAKPAVTPSVSDKKAEIEKKAYLLSKDYKDFGWLTEQEKNDYTESQNNSKNREEREKAYIKLRELYKLKVDKEFIDSIEKVHWVRNIESLISLLEKGKKIPFEISAEGYLNESFKSGWGNGVGIKLKGETLIASNEDLRSDNKYGSIENGDFRKYSYGDNTSIILNKDTFLPHRLLEFEQRGKKYQGHNEFLLKNSEIEAIVIDPTNEKLTEEFKSEVENIARKFGIPIIVNTKYDAELAASEGTSTQAPTTATVSNIEAKKEDIEKRRQEIISKYNIEFKEIARKQYDKVSKKYIDGISTQIWSNGKLIAEYETKIEAENELNRKIDALINNTIDSKISLGDNIFIEGITVDGNTFSVLNTSERMVTIVDIGGVKVPFYLTTGLGGKNLTPAWYPMFGYSPSGWLNKTDGKDMESFYSRIIGKEASDVLKKVSEKLNNKLGVTPNSIIESGIVSKQQTQEAVNSVLNFTPAENQKIDASVDYKIELAKLENNIKSLGEEINAKYDAELKALKQQSNTPTQSEIEAKKADIERRRQEELNQQTDAGYSTIALDYLFTGGRDVILSTDYLLQALVGGFTSAAKEINDIRNKYANKLGNIRDDINSDVYNQMMGEIRNVISKTYNDSKANEIFDKILKNATGFTNREGNQISIELDKLNEQNESKINAKYDAELAALEEVTPTTETNPNVEAKKADTERRRQEELNKYRNDAIALENAKTEDEAIEAIKLTTKEDNKWKALSAAENIIGKSGFNALFQQDWKKQTKILADEINRIQANFIDKINAKYDVELVALETPISKIDSPEVVQLKSAKKSLTLEIDTLMEEPSTEVLDVPSNENNVVQGLSGSEINNLATSIINSPNVFFAGMVFRTAGEDMVKRGDTFTLISERSPIGILRAKIRNAIMRRSIGSSKTLSDIGIHITIQKDKDEFHPEGETVRERQFFLDNKNKPSHPIVAVLTDINGETLYFDEDGDKTTKEKGTPIVQQIFEVDVDTASRTLQGRKEDRIQERIRVLTLQNLFSGIEITPEDTKRITDEVNEEFRMLSELKSHIRNTDEKITVNNASISRGFTEKNNIVLVPNDALVDKENAKVSVETVTINNGGTNVTKGIVYYNGFPMFMPKLSEGSLFDTIKTILQTRVPYDSFERSSRQAFLRKILYRRTEEHPKAVTKVSYDYENEKIVVMSGEQILSLEELMSRNLSLNVDKQLFDENQSFVEYVAKPEFNDRDERMPNMKLVALPAVPYQDYIKSKGYVFMTESELESQTKKLGPTPRYNIVFGMNPSETMSKITPVSTETSAPNPNDLLSVDDLLSEETTPEVGTALQNAFAVFTAPSTPAPIKQFNVGDKFKLLSKSLSQEKGSPVYVEIKLIEEIPNTAEDVKFSVEQTYEGVSTMRTYKSSTIEQGLSDPLAEKLESAETLNVFDMFTETTPMDEIMDRELIKSGVLKKGTTMEDLINTLISRNIVEKICKF